MIANLSHSLGDTNQACYQPTLDLMNAVAKNNPSRIARGQALLGLANLDKEEFVAAEYKRRPEANQLAAKARSAYEVVLNDYGDCRYLRTIGLRAPRKTLGEEAKVALFDLNRLCKDQVAPEIEGEDLDGVKFRLSDYRGKVVLLVFWASWCGPCMAEVPHERELVERFRGRPFVLVGVNGDLIKAKATKAVEDHNIPWRSFWDQGQESGTPISTTWVTLWVCGLIFAGWSTSIPGVRRP